MSTGIITGQILTPDGQPATGAPVRLTPHVRHLTTTDAVVLPSPIDVCADAAGQIRVTVVATDTMPGVEWGWLVSAESWTASTVPMWLQVPTGQTVDLVADGRVVDVTDPARPIMKGEVGVGIDTITAADGVATITLTDGTTRTINLPPGEDGRSPVVGLDGDRLTVDGVPVGDSLRGPSGHTPEVIVSGDVVTIDGQSTDPLTGPPIQTRWEGTALVVGDLPPVELASTIPGPPGDLTETTAPLTRGAATTLGSIVLARVGRGRILTATGIRAAGTSTLLGTLDAADRPPATTLGSGWLTDATAANAWGVLVGADGALTLTATPAAATILGGSISWRASA